MCVLFPRNGAQLLHSSRPYVSLSERESGGRERERRTFADKKFSLRANGERKERRPCHSSDAWPHGDRKEGRKVGEAGVPKSGILKPLEGVLNAECLYAWGFSNGNPIQGGASGS